MPPIRPRLILLCGIPGTGKTTLGDHLRAAHGFLHINREQVRWSMLTEEFVRILRERGQDVIISWGFWPGIDDSEVRELQRCGFRMVWFEGDGVAALRHFNARGTVPEHLFHEQMQRIAQLDVQSFGALAIDPFNAQGEFEPVDELARRVLVAFE